jgi:Mg2+ and Co2+ transporter CorA
VTGVEYAPLHAQSAGSCSTRFPAYTPIAALPSPDKPPEKPKQQHPRLDRSLWPAIAERARRESLRELAAEYGVSHETIRAITVRNTRSRLDRIAA